VIEMKLREIKVIEIQVIVAEVREIKVRNQSPTINCERDHSLAIILNQGRANNEISGGSMCLSTPPGRVA
jgi:hypothetical protein